MPRVCGPYSPFRPVSRICIFLAATSASSSLRMKYTSVEISRHPSMRGPLSSEAVQILCYGLPAHPLRRRLRSIWPISDLSADEVVVQPVTHPLSPRPRESFLPQCRQCSKRKPT